MLKWYCGSASSHTTMFDALHGWDADWVGCLPSCRSVPRGSRCVLCHYLVMIACLPNPTLCVCPWQLLGFYQVANRVADVYDVSMPAAVKDLLSIFEVFNINIAGIGLPLQCLKLGTFQQQLAFTMFAPLVIGTVLTAGFLLHSSCFGPKGRFGGLLTALPWLLTLSFLTFPMVSSTAFRAFSCEVFDTGSYLRADYALECESTEHQSAKSLAWLAILLWPVGVSLLYAALMLRARRAIRNDQPTALSQALSFIVQALPPAAPRHALQHTPVHARAHPTTLCPHLCHPPSARCRRHPRLHRLCACFCFFRITSQLIFGGS